MNCKKQLGFTLIELMVAVAIVAILVVVALPAYTSYVTRNKLTGAPAQLLDLRLQMEQLYQDNRTYQNPAANACGVADFDTENFSYACTNTLNSERTTYTWTATNKANVGLGGAADYTYTIKQDGTTETTKFEGATLTNANCFRISHPC